MRKVSFRKADVEGFNIFYREAGPTDAQTLLLLLKAHDKSFADLRGEGEMFEHFISDKALIDAA